MRSAARTDNPLFTRARVRLTVWYVAVLAGVLVVLGSSLYVLVREQTWSRIDSGLKLTAARAQADVASGNTNDLDKLNQVPYYVRWQTTEGVAQTSEEAQLGLPVLAALRSVAGTGGTDIRTSHFGSNEWRVYTTTVSARGQFLGIIQVARSTDGGLTFLESAQVIASNLSYEAHNPALLSDGTLLVPFADHHRLGSRRRDIGLRRRFLGIARHLLTDGGELVAGAGQALGHLRDIRDVRP